MKKNLTLLCLLAAAGAVRADDFGWKLEHAADGGGTYRLSALSPERYVLTGTRTDSSCKVARARVERRVDRAMWSQNVVMFSVRSTSGRLIRIVPEIRWSPSDAGRERLARAAKLIYRDALWHNVTLALGTDFGLPDASVRIGQVGLQIDIENWNPGLTGGIEVRNLRVCPAGEVSFAGAGEESFTIVPGERRARFTPRPDALKVFFAFDNNDLVPTLRASRRFSRKEAPVWDAQQYAGFREELLQDLDGTVAWTENLAEAEAVVYSRCRPDPGLAAEIAVAVRERGVPLYAASEVADPEVAALLPCTVEPRTETGFPERSRLVPQPGDARFAGLTDATFGQYFRCRAKAGARTLLAFENGRPALVEGRCGKGRVLYQVPAIGQTLVPGKRAYDAFFVRQLAALTDRTLPESDHDRFAPDADGWYRGLGRDDFGRFGWTFASGLLVESLGGSLRVVKGDGEYAFRPVGSARRRAFAFAPSGVTALSEGGDIRVDGRPFARFDGSLAYPGTRWSFVRPRVRFEIFGLATHAAVPLADGVRVFDARAALPTPQSWREPWLLLFRADSPCEPMLVTLQHKLAALTPVVEDGALAGYELAAAAGDVGMVGVTWPWGNAKTDASRWVGAGVPAEALARVRLWAPRSFLYPVGLTERFRRSADGRRFEIVDRYDYRETEDDWHTPRRPYAPVPPYAYYMETVCGAPSRHSSENVADALFASPDALTERLPTRTGPYADVPGDTVRWSLPVPEPDLGLLPHTLGFARYDAIANETFREGVKFSCGGGVRFEASNKAYPGQLKRVPEFLNWNMHGALLGVCRMMPNPFGLDVTNRAAYARRVSVRLLEPLETHPYKMTTRWREDPMSGARYTIYMNSPRDPQAVYEPAEFGSKFLYGDSNETIRMIAAALQMAADRHGQYGAAKANAETLFRHVAAYAFKLDDWLNLSAGCIESGSSYSIDMLNTEFGGMCSFARLAEIAGVRHAREHFLFRAARRMVPTLARLTVTDWLKRNGVLPDDGQYVDFSAGCGEAGPRPAARRPKTVRDLILYDMSQGICSDLVALYDRYAGDELKRRYFPQVRAATPESGLNWNICAILALGDDLPRAELMRRLELCAADERRHRSLCRDWPGVQTSSYLEYVYARLAGTPRISDCRDVTLHDAVYDPQARRLTLDFTPGAEARLAVRPQGGAERLVPVRNPHVRRIEEIAL